MTSTFIPTKGTVPTTLSDTPSPGGSVAATSLHTERVYLLKTDIPRPLRGDMGPIYTKRSAFCHCRHREGSDGSSADGMLMGARSASSGITLDW